MKYDAFISYRHLEKDMYVAKKVHRALETAKIPKKIQKEIGRKKINRVFRDQEELPIGSDLGSNIEAALQEAEFLIVICSPQTKDSYWVMKEIDTFISMHGRENILAVLVDGEPGDSFPPQLLTDEKGNPVEPLAADVRGKKKKEIKKKLKIETLRLAAAILKVDYDDLKQRSKERQMHKVFGFSLGISTVIVALAVAFGLYNAYNLKKINAEYQQKLINESRVLAANSLDALEDGDTTAAVLLALEGLPKDGEDRPFVADSMNALSAALDCYDLGDDFKADGLLSHNLTVEDFAINEDSNRLISCDNLKFVYLWNLDTQEKIFEIQPRFGGGLNSRESIDEVGFAGDVAVVCADDGIFGYDDEGNELYCVKPDGYSFYFSAIKDKGDDTYVLTSTDTQLWIINAKTGKVENKIDNHFEDDHYSNDVAFSKDGQYLAISHYLGNIYDHEGDVNYCTIYNLSTGEYVDVPIASTNTLDLRADKNDGFFYIASIKNDDLFTYDSSTFYLQKVSFETGEVQWVQEASYDNYVMSSSYTYVSTGDYELQDGTVEHVVAMNGTQTVYLYDSDTGELINSINVGSSIQRMAINLAGDRVVVGTSDGELLLFPIYSSSSSYTVNVTDEQMSDVLIGDGVLVARCWKSPDVVVMRVKPDESVNYTVDIPTQDYSYEDAYSPDGSTFVYHVSASDDIEDGENVYVCDTETGEVKGQFNLDYFPAYENRVHYVDNDRVCIVDSDGALYCYTISKDDLKEIDLKSESDYSTADDVYYTENDKYILLYGVRDYFVVSTDKMKVESSGEFSDVSDFNAPYTSYAIMSPDAKKIYYIDSDEQLQEFDVKNQKSKVLIDDYRCENIAISPDGSKVAVAGGDGKLRLYSVSKFKEVDQVEFYTGGHSSYNGFVQFSPDGKLLVLQGEDLYIKLYDLESKTFVFAAKYQVNEIHSAEFDYEDGRVAFINGLTCIVADLNTYGQLASIQDCEMYIPEYDMVFCQGNYAGADIYAFKFKGLDELIKLAEEKYADAEFTDAQKIKYGIE